MFKIALIIGILYAVSAYAVMHTINSSQNDSAGIIKIHPNDSAKFLPCGLSFHFEKEGMSTIPEDYDITGWIVLDSGSYKIAAYRYSESITSSQLGQFCSVVSSKNPDTLWNDSRSFPSQTYPMDTLCGATNRNPRLGKHIWNDIQLGPTSSFRNIETASNYNAIFYISCLNNTHFKFQISKIDIGNHSEPFNTYDTVKTIHVLWAHDSAGSGKFEHPTNIKRNLIISQPRNISADIYCYSLKGVYLGTLNMIKRQEISCPVIKKAGSKAEIIWKLR